MVHLLRDRIIVNIPEQEILNICLLGIRRVILYVMVIYQIFRILLLMKFSEAFYTKVMRNKKDEMLDGFHRGILKNYLNIVQVFPKSAPPGHVNAPGHISWKLLKVTFQTNIILSILVCFKIQRKLNRKMQEEKNTWELKSACLWNWTFLQRNDKDAYYWKISPISVKNQTEKRHI